MLAGVPAQAQSDLLLYVPNMVSDNISVYTTNTGGTLTPTTTISSAATSVPNYAAMRSDQAFAYVTLRDTSSIAVYNTATQSLIQSISTGTNTSPHNLAFTPDGSMLYVANNSAAIVSIYSVNTLTGMLTSAGTIALDVGSNGRGIAIAPSGATAYVVNQGLNKVSVINLATNTVVGNVTVGTQPLMVAVNPAGTFAYVTNFTTSSVSVINTATNAVVATVALAGVANGPDGIVVSRDGTRVYVASRTSGVVAVIDATNNTLITTIASGAVTNGLALSPDGTVLYATNAGFSDTVTAFSIAPGTGLLTLIGTLAAGNNPSQPGLCGNGSGMMATGRVFVANTGSAFSCTGGTATMTGGTVLMNANNITTNVPIVLATQGGTVNTNGNNATLSGSISGTGSFTKTGLGTLTLTGNSTYSGATSVNMGTLQAGITNAFSSSSSYNVASGATLDLNGFSQSIGSLSGAGNVTLGSGTLTTGNDNTTTTFSGAMSGTGGLTKLGSGTMFLTGVSTFTGPTTLNAGGLVVNGSLASSVVVNGGTLSGAGTFGGLSVNSGTLAPGNSIGTMTVNGNFTQSGGIYQVEVNAAGQSDKINVTGTAAINGGTVAVQAQSGNYARNTTYTILTANGGVSGAYSSVTSNFAFLVPSLSYNANNVFLTLAQTQSAFAAGAQTNNQYAVGTALDQANASATGDFNTVLNALSVLDTTSGPAALNAISGQQYADFGTTNIQGGSLFMNTMGQQMAVARTGSGAGQRVALAQACDVEACDGQGPFSAWISGLGGFGGVNGNNNAGGLVYNFGGAMAGIDYRIDPRFLVGIGTGYAAGNQWVNGFMGRGWTDSVSVMGYASFTQGALYVDALAGWAFSNNQMQRQIIIPGLQPRTANGSVGANQALGQVEAGYKIPVFAPAALTLTPFGRLQASTVNQSAFTEWGANSLNLSVAQQTTNLLRTTVGAELGGALPLGNTRTLDMTLRLGWLHEFADVGRPITAAFTGAPSNSFTVYGATPQRDSAVLGFSAQTAVAESTQLYLRYNGEVGSGTDNHAFNLGVRLSW